MGLTCEQINSDHRVPEAQAVARSVTDPGELHQQSKSGFYEFQTLAGERAVVYVIAQGSAKMVPASIRGLPSYQGLANADAFERGTTVIYAPGVAESTTGPSVGTRSYSDCPGGWTCIWEDRNYTDRMLQFSSTGYWQNLGNYGFNDNADSIANKRGGDSLLAEHTGGGGDRYCYDSYSAASNLGGFGDDASSIFLSTADHRC